MSSTGRKRAQLALLPGGEYVRHERDYYRTPTWCADALLLREPIHGPVLDAGCGTGAITEVLLAHQVGDVIGMDITILHETSSAPELQDALLLVHDFLAEDWERSWRPLLPAVHAVVMNPPYNQAPDFIRRALDLVEPGGKVCALLRLNFLGSSRARMDLVGYDCDLRRVYVLGARPSFLPNGKTDSAEFAWFVWERGPAMGWTSQATIEVIPPPARAGGDDDERQLELPGGADDEG